MDAKSARGAGWALALGAGWLALAAPAAASIGTAYLQVDGIPGTARQAAHQGWVVSAGHYWKRDELGLFGGRQLDSSKRVAFRRPRTVFSGPPAPSSGADQLVIALDKRNPALPALMQACRAGTALGTVRFAENSVQARGLRELGPRPAAMPEWFEYRLDHARIAACPVVEGAPEQALTIAFDGIQWSNFTGDGMGVDNPLAPAALPPIPATGEVRTFVLSWYAVAHDVADNQCPRLNAKPDQEDYYTYLPPAEAAAERAARKTTGVGYENGEMELRGPGKLNVTLLPGILPDPGHASPVSRIARGLDLDGGRRAKAKAPPSAPPGFTGFASPDGRRGIDNHLFLVTGCVPGQQGHKGFLMQYTNEQRRNGLLSILVQIAGIDDPRNDDSVIVSMLYSKDPMAKSADGLRVLPDYTFRLTESGEYAHYAISLKGRIVNGVVETEQVPVMQINGGLDPELTLHQAAMRLEFTPEGNLKGVVGGYQDWRRIMMVNGNSNAEFHYGFQAAGLYNALKRFADAMPDPETGQMLGISSAYDLEGVPAFLPPEQLQAMRAAPGSTPARGGARR